jgi:hypothetical protein
MPTPPVVSPVRVQMARPAASTRFEPARHESAWGRVKRFLLGLAAPAVEEN